MSLEEGPKQIKIFKKEEISDSLESSRFSASLKEKMRNRGKSDSLVEQLTDKEFEEIIKYLKEMKPESYQDFWERLLEIGIWPYWLKPDEEDRILEEIGLSILKKNIFERENLALELFKIKNQIKRTFSIDSLFSNRGPQPPTPPPWG